MKTLLFPTRETLKVKVEITGLGLRFVAIIIGGLIHEKVTEKYWLLALLGVVVCATFYLFAFPTWLVVSIIVTCALVVTSVVAYAEDKN